MPAYPHRFHSTSESPAADSLPETHEESDAVEIAKAIVDILKTK